MTINVLSSRLFPAQSSSQRATAGPGAPSSPVEDRASSSHLRTRPWSCPHQSRWMSQRALRPLPLSPSVSLPASTWVRWSSRPIPWRPSGPSIYVWTYDPPRLFRKVYFLTLFFFLSIFFKKQSKKIWMLETIKIQNCTSTHYIYCPSLEFVRGSGTPASATDDITVSPLLLRHLRSHYLFVFWPSLYELDWKSFGEKAWNQRRCKLSMQLI